MNLKLAIVPGQDWVFSYYVQVHIEGVTARGVVVATLWPANALYVTTPDFLRENFGLITGDFDEVVVDNGSE